MKLLGWSVASLLLGLAVASDGGSGETMAALRMQEDEASGMRVVGKLRRVVAIGGETTGWALQLESETRIRDKKVKRIEVDPAPAGVSLHSLAGKRVEVAGKVEWRRGVERGKYPVLRVDAIQQRPEQSDEKESSAP